MSDQTDTGDIAGMSEDIKKITVFGGTGMLGKPVVRELVKAGFEVTAMVRDPGRAESRLPRNVRLVEGDLQNRDDISAALDNAEAVYLNLSTRPDVKKHAGFIPERDGLENVLAVIGEWNATVESQNPATTDETGTAPSSQKKIRRVAAISSMVHRYQGMNGFRWWVFEIKQWAVRELKNAAVPTTIFYPSTFMETLDQGGVLQANRLMLVGKSRHPMYFIAGSDYGRMVARSFQLAGDEDREFDIQGPYPFTFEEATLTFLKNYRHGPLKITRVPMWPLKLAGTFSSEVHYLTNIMQAMNHYSEPKPDESVWRMLGRPEVTLSEYAFRL